MSAMQPGSGGPYADQKRLRGEIKYLKAYIALAPLGPTQKNRKKDELNDLQAELKRVNAKIREAKAKK